MEAQASGLPVVVSDKGGPQELMQHEVTGYRVAGRSVDALFRAMEQLTDPELRAKMSEAARAFTERNKVVEPFSAILDAEGYRKRERRKAKQAKKAERERKERQAAAPTVVIEPAPVVHCGEIDPENLEIESAAGWGQ